MKNQRALICGIAAAFGMLVIILDTRIAITSAREGLTLCIHTVIPSLFPFFVLSGIINSCLLGQRFQLLHPLRLLCKIPKGAESLLVLGFLAGYPVGAQLIAQAYKEGFISHKTAKRMLGFCSNAGPAFIFGILSPLFTSVKITWVLWGMHIFSALLTGCILPAHDKQIVQFSSKNAITFPESLQQSIKAMVGVCGWVILFRILLGFCNRWFLWLFPTTVQVLFSGILELANGCLLLQNIPDESMRFLLASILLSFGGICVGMQTISVTEELGTGWYFPGKITQTIITALLCYLLQPVLFSCPNTVSLPVLWGLGLSLLLLLLVYRRKKVVEFSNKLLYNTGN